jgi:hypothetical protein
MVTRQQVAHLGRRIETLAATKHSTRTAWIWRNTKETEAEARARHYRDRPEDRTAAMTYIFSWRNAGHERGEQDGD